MSLSDEADYRPCFRGIREREEENNKHCSSLPRLCTSNKLHSLLDNRNITLRNSCILVRLNDFLKYNIAILINKIFKNELRSLSTFFFFFKNQYNGMHCVLNAKEFITD